MTSEASKLLLENSSTEYTKKFLEARKSRREALASRVDECQNKTDSWKDNWFSVDISKKKLTAVFKAVPYSPEESHWTFYADGQPLFSATLDKIWGEELDEKTAKETATVGYAKDVFIRLREEGLKRVKYLLTGDAPTKEK